MRPYIGGHLRQHGGAHQQRTAFAFTKLCAEETNHDRGSTILQPRFAVTARANIFRTHGAGQKLGDDWRRGGVGGPTDRGRTFLRDALGRIAGAGAGGRLSGKISGAGESGVFGGAGICGAYRTAVLSRFVPWDRSYHADGAIPAAKSSVPGTDGRFVQR